MSGFQNYDQWKTASPYDGDRDFLEEIDKLLSEPINEWTTPPKTPLENYLVLLLQELRQILEEEAGI